MFYQFRANFKRSSEEGKAGRDISDILCGQQNQQVINNEALLAKQHITESEVKPKTKSKALKEHQNSKAKT